MLKNSLIYGAKGSSIIVTTRLQTVASIVKTISEPYRLEGLSEDDCWSLFAFYAFEAGKESVNPNLKTIGKEIVKKCGGLPLAAKALGSLLRFTVEERQWREVRDSEIWDLEEEEGNQSHKILSALRLSYNNLSPLARQCFAYCCFFPKDYKMRKEELVNLWFANGLLDFKNKEPEDVGENVFIELKLHSFFQDIEENVNWITFKIHDLVHDLASSVMEREHKHIEAKVGEVRNTINSIETQNPEIRLRHMSTTLLPSSQSSLGGVSDIHPLNLFQQHPLRTLILFSNGGDMEIYSHDMLTISGLKRLKALKIGEWGCGFRIESLPLAFGDKLKHLRYLNLCCCGLSSLQAVSFDGMKNLQVLDLSWNRIDVIPDSIGNLECLRHLNISNNNNDRLELLPESLGNLTKLETLKLNGCKALKMLPQNTSKLCSLKRLENEDCLSLRGMPSGLGQGLSRLEKLSWWPWVCGRGESESMEELRGLSLLGGSLEIRMLGLSIENNVAHNNSLHDVEEEEVLTNKTNLSQLRIYFDIGAGYIDEGGSEQLLQVLKPPSNIESFVLKRYGGRRFPAWMQMRDPGSSFPRLRRIELDGIINVEEWWLNWRENECLPALQDLNISYCRILKALPEELGNLTTLKSLLISSCGALLSVPPCLLKLTSLETLSIICCPRVRSMPKLHLMTSLKRLNILDCPQLEFVFHGLRHLTSLQDLWIDGCPGVVLPGGGLGLTCCSSGSILSQRYMYVFFLFLHVIVHIIKAIDQSVVY
ncbi:hypothetical protein Sjap_006783 [Stephania japonica]|uniref:NB-ARC domain-containing protein n=1 Tax=Stephania japonica TaxID=461633 RepID=A0AAP0K934_9MAGN